MSIIQSVIGSVQGGSSPPYYYLGLSGNYGEGNTLTLYLNYERARGQAIYWSLASDSATAGVDFTTNSGNYSGILTPVGTSNGYVLDYVTFVADHLTEGTEYLNLRLGTYAGGNDLQFTGENINDTSVAAMADFTIEWWQKMSSSQGGSNPRVFDVTGWPTENPGISFESSGIYIWGGPNSGSAGASGRDYVSSAYIGDTYNTWTHWAIERHNGTMAFYKNGYNILSTNNLGSRSINNSSSILTIGSDGGGGYWTGKIADFHWIKGSAKYQGNFSVPTSTIAARTGTKLLLNFASSGSLTTDSSGLSHSLSNNGSVTWDSDSPYSGGSGSAVFSGNYLSVPASTDWAIDG